MKLHVWLATLITTVFCSLTVIAQESLPTEPAAPNSMESNGSSGENSPLEREDADSGDEKNEYKKNVIWYYPEILEDGENSKKKRSTIKVILSGKTQPGAKVYVGSKFIPVELKGKIRKFRRDRAFVSKKERIATADEKGIFVYPLWLPQAQVKLPLKIRFKDKTSQSFQLNLQVEAKQVEITNQEGITRSPIFKKPFAIWLGAGFNYVRTDQSATGTTTALTSDLLFESFKAPSFSAKVKGNISDNWDLLYSYKLSPGETTSGETQVKEGTYTWQTHTIEGRWSPDNWRMTLLGDSGQWSLRLGAQHHIVPFIISEAQDVASIKENSITMASIGGQFVEVLNYPILLLRGVIWCP